MRYFRLVSAQGDLRIAVEVDEGVLSDITSVDEDISQIDDLAMAAALSGDTIDGVVRRMFSMAQADIVPLEDLGKQNS